MATGKKSFILYCDQRGTWERLSDEQAGKLIKHVLAYVNDENPESDFVTELAFEGIKRALKSDLIKYEQIKTKRVEAGRKGGKQTQAKQAIATFAQANQAVNVNGNGNVNVTEIYSKENKRTDPSIYFDNQELNNLFLKWIEMCGQKGKAYPQVSVEALQMKLNSQSEDKSIKQVRQSLEKGWVNLRVVDETESKVTAQEAEDINISLLKHLRDVQSIDNNTEPSKHNRLRGVPKE
jgi:hypothetical protein